jgi:hypothetical protein
VEYPRHLKTPITVEDLLNPRMIAYPFLKWPAAQAAVVMRNRHREIATFVCYVRSVKQDDRVRAI